MKISQNDILHVKISSYEKNHQRDNSAGIRKTNYQKSDIHPFCGNPFNNTAANTKFL